MIHRLLDSCAPEPVSHDPEIAKRVLLRRGEVPHVLQYAVTTLEPGQVARSPVHPDMVELFLCTEGTGSMVVEGTPHELVPGALIAVEPGESHELSASPAEALRVVVIALQV